MRAAFVALGSLAILAAPFLAGHSHADASTGPIPLNCDRACLENVVNQYIAALVAHDPKRVPLSETLSTPRTSVMNSATASGRPSKGRGNYKHVFADPDFGQVALMGTMVEAGAPLLMSLRLRIELGRITEIESIYFRPGGGGPNNIAAMDAPSQARGHVVQVDSPAQQMSRQELIAVADGYFTGLQHNDGKGINGTGTYPFTDDCSRIENGSSTAKAPRATLRRPTASTAFAMDCMAQFKLGYYFVVQNIHDRRYPVVDRERGVVWAHVVFDQAR